MSFHPAKVELDCVGGLKAVTAVLTSDAPKRSASRSPSRPNALPVVVPVVRVRLALIFDIDAAGNIETDAGSTLPLCEAVAAAPKPALPLTVIRTGGRR